MCNILRNLLDKFNLIYFQTEKNNLQQKKKFFKRYWKGFSKITPMNNTENNEIDLCRHLPW